MMLKEYMDKYEISPVAMAYHVETTPKTIYSIFKGAKTRQKLAERIEAYTSKLVTVKELRGGRDLRKVPKKKAVGRPKTGAEELEKAKKMKKDPYNPIILSEKRRDTYSDVLAKQRQIHAG